MFKYYVDNLRSKLVIIISHDKIELKNVICIHLKEGKI